MFSFGETFLPFGFGAFAGGAALCVFGFYVCKRLCGEGDVSLRDSSTNHTWTPIRVTDKSWYCSICESFLIHGAGVYCDCCGVCADPQCVKRADQTLRCKVVASTCQVHLHHWVKGNLPGGAACAACGDDCSAEPGLVDFECCWCQRTVHVECLKSIGEECDFGRYRSMIVPPFAVQVVRRKGRLKKQLLLKAVTDPGWDGWTPLVVVGNTRSGNSDGAAVLSAFRKFLNPVQVVDLTDRQAIAALQWCVLLAPKAVRLVVAGGDGTIARVLTASHKLDLEPEPLLGIIPLGTGNDLSRVLGWGKENPSEVDVARTLDDIGNARISELDRWRVDVTATRHLPIPLQSKVHYLYNYLSVGVDAQVALSFHKTRQSAFYLYGSRLFNKLLYLCFGTQQALTADCKNLERRLELYLDGRNVALPELESIVVLNIASWAAGVDLWDQADRGGACANRRRALGAAARHLENLLRQQVPRFGQ
ncbi:diacylglycerol kinase epsilon isoform X2 [Cylas formicarius]|uniref:diacylglycerol kinase epsilon isoform X2 n=1 Tax=Cylas formicarius TaxID=197179 RepID=UPI002958C94D|nr:diacylglycerol kinase epsilon isoform X2 [Cylas formicarius]